MDLKLSGRLSGNIIVPPSKSLAHRHLICASLADMPSGFECGATGDDIEATANCLKTLGASVKYSDGSFRIWPIESVARGCTLDCNESGTTLRFMMPIAAVLNAEASFIGSGRLAERPLSPLYEQMQEHGMMMSRQGIWPLRCSGHLTGGDYTLASDISSQFISGLLFALPLAEQDSTITLTGTCQSKSYLNLTLNTLMHAGITVVCNSDGFYIPGRQKYSAIEHIAIEGDWSAAAFWLVAGVIGNSQIECRGINFEKSLQGDKAIVSILKDMGADIKTGDDTCTAFPSHLHGTTIDCTDIPDLVPALSIAAACAVGDTEFTNIGRLRFKESDRIETIRSMLEAFGIQSAATDNTLIVRGGSPKAGTVSSGNDHRIAMAAAVMSSVCQGETLLEGVECVAKSYPDFFNDFHKAGGQFC